ncbi:MAG: arginine deiminase family protein [Acidobacteriota bacterium]
MVLQVASEIGRLRRVLVHRPGPEIDHMVPAMMERLLFDDILYGQRARKEHDSFAQVLHAAGVETLDPQDLLVDVLGDAASREQLLARLGERGASSELLRQLGELEPTALAASVVTGILSTDGPPESFYLLDPIPNYFFQRDPQVVFGDRVLMSSMATDARDREPLLSRTIFEQHPALAGAADLFDLRSAGIGGRFWVPHLEGGDMLIPSAEVILVGLSERTNRRGIDTLARYLRREETTFRNLIVVEIPPQRSYMHLDTVFTFIDHGLCLAYLPVIAAGGHEAGDVYRVDLNAPELAYTLCDSLTGALAGAGLEVELVPCGGADSLIDQQREQWTDGANAFAIAPGVIATYRRNRRTTEELNRRGWRVVTAEDVISGREALLDQGPTVVVLLDNELSRARGGPRCMTMPLERDPV